MEIYNTVRKALNEQEKFLLSLRETVQRRLENINEHKQFNYERAKFIGMIDIATTLDVDVSDFNWIYNL